MSFFNPSRTIVIYDSGKEFSYDTEIPQKLGAADYFAHLYHSWECGLNENTNELLHEYFSKGV